MLVWRGDEGRNGDVSKDNEKKDELSREHAALMAVIKTLEPFLRGQRGRIVMSAAVFYDLALVDGRKLGPEADCG